VVYAATHPTGSADIAGRVCLIQIRAIPPQDAQSSEWAVVHTFIFIDANDSLDNYNESY